MMLSTAIFNFKNAETVAQASAGQTFPPGTGLIFLDNVDCTGNENGIFLECDHQPVGTSDCIHSQDAGVVCVPGNDIHALCVKIHTLTGRGFPSPTSTSSPEINS